MAEPVGRPSKLTPEMLERARTYLNECNDEIHTTDKGAVSYVEVQLPSIVGLAKYLKVNKDTIHEWRKVNEEFSDIVKEILAEQEIRLLNNGLGGLYTSKALGALLSKHGYVEENKTDLTSKGEKLQITGMQIIKDEPIKYIETDSAGLKSILGAEAGSAIAKAIDNADTIQE